ncbi:MAG: peptidoglycan-associated lipoprotein Pal [Deltaproteobacteria bacterium]|nr:peptidoglycan-associated lipoprotein Pal [Deltaproteobacteria bacterium]
MKEPPVQEGGEQPQVAEEELVALQNLQEKAVREGAFGDVYFDFNVYTLKEESKATMTKTAEWLTTHPTVSIMIEGHCDERGTQEYNLALGERRGASVQKYLYSLGIDLARMQTISYGEERPADPGHDEEAWAKNRRVHFTITKR